MKTTVRNDMTETRIPSIEETLYGPPQHSTRGTDTEQTFYGVPQHETDVVVNADPWELPVYRYHWEIAGIRSRTRFTSGRVTEVAYP